MQLQNNNTNIQTKNKNNLKYFLHYNYKFFCLIIENEKTNIKTRAILPTTSCTEVKTTAIVEHIASSSDAVVECVQTRNYHSINYDNSLVRTSNFSLDIVVDSVRDLERLQ